MSLLSTLSRRCKTLKENEQLHLMEMNQMFLIGFGCGPMSIKNMHMCEHVCIHTYIHTYNEIRTHFKHYKNIQLIRTTT